MPTPAPNSPILDQILCDATIRQLFDFIPGVCFFIKDRAGRLIYCNEAHRRSIFRYADANEIYGKSNYDFFPNALATAFAEDDLRVIQTGEPLLEHCELNITSSGSLCWFCTTKIPVRNSRGSTIGLIGISRQLEKADARMAAYELLAPALEYIHHNCTGRIKVPTLAAVCHMTEATFRREFQRLFRLTPLRFILRLRLHEACLRLSGSTTSIGDIAYECGFEDQNYFARHFKQTIGITPTEFREQHTTPIQVGT